MIQIRIPPPPIALPSPRALCFLQPISKERTWAGTHPFLKPDLKVVYNSFCSYSTNANLARGPFHKGLEIQIQRMGRPFLEIYYTVKEDHEVRSMLPVFLFICYLAVSGHSCGPWDICCVMQGLSSWLMDSSVAACGLQSCCARPFLHSMWDLSSQLGIQALSPALQRLTLNHWTSREVPNLCYLLNDTYFHKAAKMHAV